MKTNKKSAATKVVKIKRSELTHAKGAVRQFNFEKVGTWATINNCIISARARVGL